MKKPLSQRVSFPLGDGCVDGILESKESLSGKILDEEFRKIREANRLPLLTDEFLEWSINEGRE